MDNLHIPPEVIEATATQMAFDNCQIFSNLPEVTKSAWRFRARAAITAALAAWPGMKASPSWGLRTHERRVEIVLPIIRTEAST